MDHLASSSAKARQAWQLALAGETEEAWRLLVGQDEGHLTLEGADLLARLAVRHGRLAKAREIWNEILRVDPTYGPAVQAMEYMDSPRLLYAAGRKLLSLLAILIGACLAAVGGWALVVGIPNSLVAAALTLWMAIAVAAFLAGVGVWILFAGFLQGVPRRISGNQDPSEGQSVAPAASIPEHPAVSPGGNADALSACSRHWEDSAADPRPANGQC